MCDNCIKKAAEDKTALMARTDAIIDRIGTSRDKVIPLLQALQEEFNYLQSDVLERVYDRTEIDRAQLVSVSTFYSLFRHIPYGKHVIKICNGTACHRCSWAGAHPYSTVSDEAHRKPLRFCYGS